MVLDVGLTTEAGGDRQGPAAPRMVAPLRREARKATESELYHAIPHILEG